MTKQCSSQEVVVVLLLLFVDVSKEEGMERGLADEDDGLVCEDGMSLTEGGTSAMRSMISESSKQEDIRSLPLEKSPKGAPLRRTSSILVAVPGVVELASSSDTLSRSEAVSGAAFLLFLSLLSPRAALI